jgi:hypothetical protein
MILRISHNILLSVIFILFNFGTFSDNLSSFFKTFIIHVTKSQYNVADTCSSSSVLSFSSLLTFPSKKFKSTSERGAGVPTQFSPSRSSCALLTAYSKPVMIKKHTV